MAKSSGGARAAGASATAPTARGNVPISGEGLQLLRRLKNLAGYEDPYDEDTQDQTRDYASRLSEFLPLLANHPARAPMRRLLTAANNLSTGRRVAYFQGKVMDEVDNVLAELRRARG